MPEWICRTAHVGLGFVAGLTPLGSEAITDMFAWYELNEEKNLERQDHRIDASYQEFREYLGGMVAGTVCKIAGIIYVVNMVFF